MDWEPLVSHLTQARRPALVMDGAGRVRFVNAPMVQLLGRRVDELSSTRWLAPWVPPGAARRVRRLLGAGLRGEATDGELTLLSRDGKRVLIHVELLRAVRGRSRGLVLAADGLRDGEPTSTIPVDCWCEVSREAGATIVKSLRFLDPRRDASRHVGHPLEDLLTLLLCRPAMRWIGEVLAERERHASDVLLPATEDAFRVVAADALDSGKTRVTVRTLEARLLPELVDAKAARTAFDRGLSERERQVLTLLLRGRGVEDIATMLDIAPRTVKFHQANVLQKLGADSRLDLLRVLL
jgi:DNA-binding CsgD family transcriptional regulator